jgi:hypothetical protein
MTPATKVSRTAGTLGLLLAVCQSTGCASASLAPRSIVAVGEPSSLVCAAGEVQMCREYGSAVECRCSQY